MIALRDSGTITEITMKIYRYHLLKYNCPKTRFKCPKCGRPHCFTPYVDNNGNIVDIERFGRCDHECSCGYHLYPPYEPNRQGGNHFALPKFRKIPEKRCEEPKQDLCTLPMDIVRKTLVFTPKNAFATFRCKIFYEDTAKALSEKYHIGTTKDERTVFYQFDIQGRCRGGKIIPYDPETGHRIKDDRFPPLMWVHTNLKAAHLLPPEWKLTQCLFGEHLLQDKVNANVALVESEKTAVICSLLLPEYIWLATGGKSQFNDRLMALKGRKVTAFPDIDGYDEWRKKAKNYPMLDITISDILERNATPEQRERQVDIADVLLEEMLKERHLK